MQIETQSRTLTVEGVWRRALPLGTEVLAGGERLDSPVRWATVITPDSIPYLEGGELLLLAPGETNEAALVQLIETTQQADVAGIIIADEWSPALLGAAQLAELPVLRLPLDSHIREVEQAIISLILDRAQDADRRSAQIYQQLVQIAADAGGLDRLIHELSRLTDKAIVVQDKRLHVQYLAVPPRLAADWDRLSDWLSQREVMPAQFQDRHRLPLRTTPTLIQSIPNTALARLITPIVTQNVG